MYSISYRLLLLFSLVLPLQIALNPIEGIDLALVRIIIPIIFLVWLFECLFSKKVTLPISAGALFLYAFLFFAVFSLLFATNPSWGVRKLLFLFSLLPLYFVASATLFTEKRKQTLAACLAAGAAATALIGLAQFFLQYIFGISKAYAWWGQYVAPVFLGKSFSQAVLENSSWLVNAGGTDFFRVISVFPDPHMLAFYLNMVLPFAIFFAIDSSSKKRAFWLISIALIFFADILTFSRGGYLGLFALAFVLFIPLLKKLSFRTSLAACAILLFIVISLFSFSNPVSERLLSSLDPSEGSNSGRIETWSQALDVIKNNPLGVGIGNYALEIKPSADYREPIYAHSLYLDITAEMGVFALLALLAFFAASIVSFNKNHTNSFFYLAAIASLAAFTVHSLVENPLFSVHVFSLFILIAALANSPKLSTPHA